MTEAARAIVSVTFAPACVACQRVLDAPLDGPVCAACWTEARQACGRYDGALRHIIHAFKYEGRRTLAYPLASLLREQGALLLRDADCVVPVPLFVWRRLRRGFNQSADLAAHLGHPAVDALWRTRPTRPQAGLSASMRRRNVRGAFRLSPWLAASTRRRFIEDRIVILVDDVLTTGATLSECGGVLRAAGAREVRQLTLARAPLEKGRHGAPHIASHVVAVPIGVEMKPSR